MWLIEEYLNTLRKEVWFNPPIAPIVTDIIIVINIIFLLYSILLMILKGAIFCQVISIREGFHVILAIISGTHIWKGAAPVLTNNLMFIK